jgi:hypothetical protein
MLKRQGFFEAGADVTRAGSCARALPEPRQRANLLTGFAVFFFASATARQGERG